MNLHYSRKSLEFGLILYDRETDDIRSNVYTVNAEGLNVFTPFNVGHRSGPRGAIRRDDALVQARQGHCQHQPVQPDRPDRPASGGGEDTMFRYTGNATVEWHGKEKGKTPGDVGSAQLTYESPSREFQFRREGYVNPEPRLHAQLQPDLSVTGNLTGLGTMHSRHRLIAPLVQESYDKREGPEFKLKLVKTLGRQ